jgi:hypothetical protein
MIKVNLTVPPASGARVVHRQDTTEYGRCIMENSTHEQITDAVYEPPVLVEMGEFSEDTLATVPPNIDGVAGRF